MPSDSNDQSHDDNKRNHSLDTVAQARPLTYQEEETILRTAVPEAFDRYGLFDGPSASGLLVHNVVAPNHRQMLSNHLNRDARQRIRPIPDVPGRLPYEPGPGAMSGLANGTTTSTREADMPVAASSSPALVSQHATSATFVSAAPPQAQNASHAVNGPADVQPSSSEIYWSEADTRRLFSLRAQHVPFKEVSKHFPGKSEKACQEKFYKTKNRDQCWSNFFCDEQRKHQGGRGGGPPPPPPPGAGQSC